MKYLVVLALITIAFGAGVFLGWDSGVRDAHNLEVSSVQH